MTAVQVSHFAQLMASFSKRGENPFMTFARFDGKVGVWVVRKGGCVDSEERWVCGW